MSEVFNDRSTNQTLIQEAFVRVLGRLADTEGLQFWLKWLSDPNNNLENLDSRIQEGELDKLNKDTATSMAESLEYGDIIKFQIEVFDNIIADARSIFQGSESTNSASVFITEWVKGKTLIEAESLQSSYVAQELQLSSSDNYSAILAENAVKNAIVEYRTKQSV